MFIIGIIPRNFIFIINFDLFADKIQLLKNKTKINLNAHLQYCFKHISL